MDVRVESRARTDVNCGWRFVRGVWIGLGLEFECAAVGGGGGGLILLAGSGRSELV